MYSFLFFIVSSHEEEEEEEEEETTSIEHSVSDMEKHLHFNLDSIFMVTENDGDSKQLPLDQIRVWVRAV